jgi:hypothetical protein
MPSIIINSGFKTDRSKARRVLLVNPFFSGSELRLVSAPVRAPYIFGKKAYLAWESTPVHVSETGLPEGRRSVA